MSDNINTQFIDALLYNRSYSKSRKTVWFANGCLGYISYKNKAVLIDNFTFTGENIGASLDLGVDFTLGKNFYFGLGLGYTIGALNKLKVINGVSTQTIKLEEDNYESLYRINISSGLRWAW